MTGDLEAFARAEAEKALPTLPDESEYAEGYRDGRVTGFLHLAGLLQSDAAVEAAADGMAVLSSADRDPQRPLRTTDYARAALAAALGVITKGDNRG